DPNGVHVALSTGASFDASTVWTTDFTTGKGWASQDASPRMMADFNGDGKADIIGFGMTGVNVGISDGNTFTAKMVSSEFVGSAWASQNNTPRFAGDVDGDGKA